LFWAEFFKDQFSRKHHERTTFEIVLPQSCSVRDLILWVTFTIPETMACLCLGAGVAQILYIDAVAEQDFQLQNRYAHDHVVP